MVPLRSVPTLTILAVLLATALAGCVDETKEQTPLPECEVEPCDDVDGLIKDGRDLRIDLLANDTLEAPVWEVGDHFGQHIFDGADDSTGYHIDSMVIEDTGGSWVIATDNEELARRHAFWDYPFLGTFGKEDLSTTGYGVAWDFLFEFPLTDGKTWQRTIVLPHTSFFWDNTYDVTFTVAYAATVETFEGDYPGFQITAVTATDETLFSYYYVPQIGWYDQFYWYNIETEDPEDYRLKAISMGTGKNWTGTYHVAEKVATHAVENFFCPFVVDPFCQPTDPVTTFTLESADNRLVGQVIIGAYGGHSRAVVQPPEGSARTYEHTHDEVPDVQTGPTDFDAVTNIVWYDEDVIPGEWRVTNAGSGAAWGCFYTLHELAMTTGTMPANGTS